MAFRTTTKDENVPCPRTLIMVATRDTGRATLGSRTRPQRSPGYSTYPINAVADKVKISPKKHMSGNLWLANCYFSSHRACNVVTSFRWVSRVVLVVADFKGIRDG